jgi:hypothetical protein
LLRPIARSPGWPPRAWIWRGYGDGNGGLSGRQSGRAERNTGLGSWAMEILPS